MAISAKLSSTFMDAQVLFEDMPQSYITTSAPELLLGVVLLGSGTKSHEYQKVLKGRTGLSTVMLGQLSAHVFAKAQ